MESKRHSFWIGFNKPPFDKFLENGLSYFMENGHPTKAIKASSKLRDNYKEIDNWANNCSLTLGAVDVLPRGDEGEGANLQN